MSLNRLPGVAEAAIGRLQENLWSLLQITIAATVAFALAEWLLETEDIVFAPVAAVVSLSVTLGRRGRRAAELVAGVAVGLAVSDLVILVLGSGPLRVGLVALLAASTAVAVGGSPLFINQAAIAALVVGILQPLTLAASATRLVDALIGCGVALAVNTLLPLDPRRSTGRTGRALFDSLRRVVEQAAAALQGADLALAERALREARRLQMTSAAFADAVNAAEAAARLGPLPRLRSYDATASRATADRLDLVLGDIAALTRGAANLVRHGASTAPELIQAVRHVADAISHLVPHLDGTEGPDALRELALTAAAQAMGALRGDATLASCMVVGQVRTTAVDLLVMTGVDQPDAVSLLEGRAGTAMSVRFRRASG